jgi:hypothetical protein
MMSSVRKRNPFGSSEKDQARLHPFEDYSRGGAYCDLFRVQYDID